MVEENDEVLVIVLCRDVDVVERVGVVMDDDRFDGPGRPIGSTDHLTERVVAIDDRDVLAKGPEGRCM